MKTIRTILFVAFAAIAFTACQKELADSDQTTTPKTIVTFSGDLDQVEADTKTTMWYETGLESGKFTTYFMDADHITVNGYESGNIIKVEGTNGSKFNFEIPFDEGKDVGPYYAATAYHVDEEVNPNYDETTHTYTLLVSSNQSYRLAKSNTVTSFYTGADILAAYGEDLHLSFKHLSTFLAISLEGETEFKDNIKTVYVRQGDGGNIAGRWYLKFDGNNEPYLEPDATKLTNVIKYNCVVSDIAENGVEQSKVLIIGVPSYDYPEGLLVTIKDVNGNFASYHIKEANYKSKGGVIIPFKPKFNPGSGVIKTAADWEDFAAAVNSGNDSKLYRWVGNGTVKLGANIEAENLSSITKTFPYVFDGDGFSIKREKATKSLFYELSGEIKNLTLEGTLTLTDDGAPFVKNLCAGARITDCTNNMNVTFNVTSGPFYIGGIASIMVKQDSGDKSDTQIVGCKNKGQITGTGNFTTKNGTVAIGGIVADIRAAGGNAPYDVVFTGCTNEGSINFAPIPPADNATTGMKLCGIGGIAGWLRSGKALTFDTCVNKGNITLSAEHMTNDKAMEAYAICVGGIIGFGTVTTNSLVTKDGYDITLNKCTNSGVLYNCGDNYSKTTEWTNKVYTGGLAGSLMGLSNKYASIKTCANTGNIFTYDLVTGDQTIVSQRPAYNAVAGGLVGYGGYLDIDGCTVNCQIGSGKRAMVAWGGMVGFLVKPFNLKDSKIHLSGYFQRISNYKFNRAVVGVVPLTGGAAATDISGSKITGTLEITGLVHSSGSLLSSGTSKTNLSGSYDSDVLNSLAKVKANLVNGGTADNNTTLMEGVTNTATITYSAN